MKQVFADTLYWVASITPSDPWHAPTSADNILIMIRKTYVRFPDKVVDDALADLTLGAVYKVLPTPQPERHTGLLRIIDNLGEDSLYPASYFQPLDWST